MATNNNGNIVQDAIKMVRKGEFARLLAEVDLASALKDCSRADVNSAENVASRAILAETYDQLGQYHLVSEYANHSEGELQLKQLDRQLSKTGSVSDEGESLVLARARLVLQCAIAEFRANPRSERCIPLLETAIELVEKHGPKALANKTIRTLYHFWRGRMRTARFQFREAKAAFDEALVQIDYDLANAAEGENQIALRASSEQIAEGIYVLSTCHGFGFGQLYQLQGNLTESINHLRVALPLSRGSLDLHRRGYTHLLMGTALRSMGSPSDAKGQLDDADNHLRRAAELFGEQVVPVANGREYCSPRHYLHMARANHQLALAHYTMAEPQAADEHGHLNQARSLIESAHLDSVNESCKSFTDPILTYGILVVKSMVLRSLDNAQEAQSYAERAIQMAEDGLIPKWTQGGGYIACGRALTTLSEQKPSDKRRFEAEAEAKFKKALDIEGIRDTDKAAAHLFLSRLYLSKEDLWQASVHLSHASPLVENTQHGWLRNLASAVQNKNSTAGGYRPMFDLEALSDTAQRTGKDQWNYVMSEVTKNVQHQMIRLNFQRKGVFADPAKGRSTKELAEIIESMGVSRATAYKWLMSDSIQSLLQPLQQNKRKKPGQSRRG